MDLALFDYELPPEAVAQVPVDPRDAARLLVIDRATGRLEDRGVRDLPELLRPGDCVVVNNSRVIPARVFARDEVGRPVELLFLEPAADDPSGGRRWWALVRPGRRARPGTALAAGGEPGIRLTVVGAAEDGRRMVEAAELPIPVLLDHHGLPPLPPYIRRHAKPAPEDWDRYQTVYARVPGSVAAPTAGCHFTPALLAALRARGVSVHELTLHVGVATFRPIRTRAVEDHELPPERVVLPREVAEAVNRARREGRRVVAVGTTTTRALEGSADGSGSVHPRQGTVDLYITPGYRFRVVDALLTNFHLPRSSLLVLVAAFAGRELVLRAYRHALAAGYRFYSYGDATLIL
jgi:S-adenosylmethionine:tRNA ribosyltransferase-isomerase